MFMFIKDVLRTRNICKTDSNFNFWTKKSIYAFFSGKIELCKRLDRFKVCSISPDLITNQTLFNVINSTYNFHSRFNS